MLGMPKRRDPSRRPKEPRRSGRIKGDAPKLPEVNSPAGHRALKKLGHEQPEEVVQRSRRRCVSDMYVSHAHDLVVNYQYPLLLWLLGPTIALSCALMLRPLWPASPQSVRLTHALEPKVSSIMQMEPGGEHQAARLAHNCTAQTIACGVLISRPCFAIMHGGTLF